MKQFRVTAIIDSPDLGEIVGMMQEAGSLIQGLDVMGEPMPTRKMLEIQETVNPKQIQHRSRAHVRAQVGTAPAFIERFMSQVAEGVVVRRRDLMKAGMAAGHNSQSLSTALHAAHRKGTLARVRNGEYTFVRTQQVQQEGTP